MLDPSDTKYQFLVWVTAPRNKHNSDLFSLLLSFQNSIRHNLSLHSRFIRVQNEGTGKSSWWMLNPEGGKMGKGPRRRAASIDNGPRFLKTKGRAGRKKGGIGRGQGTTTCITLMYIVSTISCTSQFFQSCKSLWTCCTFLLHTCKVLHFEHSICHI